MGQTFNLAHIIPFVEISRRRLREKYIKKYEKMLGITKPESHTSVQDDVDAFVEHARAPKTDFPDKDTAYAGHNAVLPHQDTIEAMVDSDLRDEISDGIQTIQYQLITLMTTNGQAPFVSMYINIEELSSDEPAQQDMAMVIREVLMQRIVGVPNEDNVFLPTAFPKILYVIDENNKPGEKFSETDDKPKSKFWDLTYLAAICSASVMTPDYISAKQMRALKNGDVYACMGCVDGESVICYKLPDGTIRSESFEHAFEHMSELYKIKTQPNGRDHYIDTDGIEIFDNIAHRYVKQYRIIRNTQNEWYRITFDNGTIIDATDNHPFEIIDRTINKSITTYTKGTSLNIIFAKDLSIGDKMIYETATAVQTTKQFTDNILTAPAICSVVNIEYHHESKFSYDVTTETDHFMVNGIYSHNCRSFLTVDRFSEEYGNIANAMNYKPDTHKYWGRFNAGVSTISLPHAALSSSGDFDKFWKILDERTELNHRFLQKRIERLLGTPSDVAPLLWQRGVYARLKPGETIDKLLYHGYATISLGYAGLYECVKYMTGHSHMDSGEGEAFGIKVLEFLNEKCRQWREAEDIDYSLYGTPEISRVA